MSRAPCADLLQQRPDPRGFPLWLQEDEEREIEEAERRVKEEADRQARLEEVSTTPDLRKRFCPHS